MTIIQSLILGIVQGITEFLPVSSSGHLVIFEALLGMQQTGIFFEVLLHTATLGAVVVFFFPVLRKLTVAKVTLLILGTLPAAVIGILFKSTIESLFDSVALVALGLLVTAGINLGIAYYLRREQDAPITWKRALLIGALQAIAITPGISRSGSTIFAGLQSGLSRQQAFEFSFLLSIPAIRSDYRRAGRYGAAAACVDDDWLFSRVFHWFSEFSAVKKIISDRSIFAV